MGTTTCSVEGCDRTAVGRGYCGRHYARWRKTGDPVYVPPTVLERAMAKVDKAESGCWEWTGAKVNGYGRISVGGREGNARVAHRVIYELTVGPVPAGMDLDHLCINPGCVNPDHLEPVSHAENMRRGPTNVAARNAAKTRCPQGHPYDEENTGYRKNGDRICRTCDNARSRAYYYKRKSGR